MFVLKFSGILNLLYHEKRKRVSFGFYFMRIKKINKNAFS